ncbi:unnamed protein product, partial [Larinioides sclopetarius]
CPFSLSFPLLIGRRNTLPINIRKRKSTPSLIFVSGVREFFCRRILCSLVSEMVSVLLLQLNVKYMKGKLFLQFTANNLKFLLIFGCAMFLMSLAFSVFLLVMGVKYETEFNFIYNNAYFAFVPCLVSNFWFVVLVYDVWNFMKLREEQNGAPSSIR